MKRNFNKIGNIILMCILISFINTVILAQALTLTIAEPKSGKEVGQRAMVGGKVSDAKLQVFILIRPMATEDFWVQNPPNIASDGTWAEYCYFGEPGIGKGEPYEIIAVATPNKQLLKRGQRLKSPLQGISEILIRSDPIVVIRTK